MLAIFDLDETLLAGDSEHLWCEYLIEQGLVDASYYKTNNDQFYQDYQNGCLDMDAFLRFSLQPLTQFSIDHLNSLRKDYLEKKIEPIILPEACKRIEDHRRQGHTLLIITATNRFITGPIAEMLGISQLLATEPEFGPGGYSGNIVGEPCFKEGKVLNLLKWLNSNPHSMDDSWFYSDSYNDLPLLQKAQHPVVVDADDKLYQHAVAHNWERISLRG